MLERQVVIPVSPDQLWDALTEPTSLSAWFGSRVDWDLRPGGQARFVDDDGTSRLGVIDAVCPGRHLSFRWWRDEGTGGGASQVTYHLEPDEDGTRLTVTEELVAGNPAPVTARGAAAAGTGAWTVWDSRLLACWAQAAALIR